MDLLSDESNDGDKVNKSSVEAVPLDVLDHVKLNQTLETPYSIFKGCVKAPMQKEAIFNKENLKEVEAKLKQAFVEFYHKIRLLKGYR